jgi:3-phosphoshikimate 1-carboxyvinyltransferase
MARGESQLSGVLESEDTTVMVEAWKQLGLSLDWNRQEATLRIEGCAGQPPSPHGKLFIANSGTSIRFLTAALAATNGEYTLDGVPRMRERPIGDLLEGLRVLGADVQSANPKRDDCPPVFINAQGLKGGRTCVAGNVSSQFLSGLLMAAPYAQSPVKIQVQGELVSKPYVDMTCSVMDSFGVTVTRDGDTYAIPAPTSYSGRSYRIEPDASAASYFWAAAALTGGCVRVDGLDFDSLQGDVGFAKVLEQMGCTVRTEVGFIEVEGGPLRGIDIDMNMISDTVQTLAPVALFASGPTRIRGVAHNRHKETDRIGDLARELRRFGSQIDEHEDGLTIHPIDRSRSWENVALETYRDHRMAMGLSLIGLVIPHVFILDPRCTSKTFPEYFEVLGRLIRQSPTYG